MSIEESHNQYTFLDNVYGRQLPDFREITIINLDVYIKIAVEKGLSLRDVKLYIHNHAANQEVANTCKYIVPLLYNHHETKQSIGCFFFSSRWIFYKKKVRLSV